MKATELVVTLARLGAVVTVMPDRALKVRAPKGTLTPDLLHALRAHKEEVLVLLEGPLPAWHESTADRVLSEMLIRVAIAYRVTGRRVYARTLAGGRSVSRSTWRTAGATWGTSCRR